MQFPRILPISLATSLFALPVPLRSQPLPASRAHHAMVYDASRDIAQGRRAVRGPAASADTVFLEVGSPLVDGRVFTAHAARVRVYRGDTLTAQWLNELTVADSAGRRIHRWVTTSEPVSAFPNRPLSVLRQTYDAMTLAPLGYWSKANNGAETQLTIDSGRVRGRTRTASDTTWRAVDKPTGRLGYFSGASDIVPVAAGLKPGSILVAPVWSPGTVTAEDRVFVVSGDTTIVVEGSAVTSRKVEERRRSDGSLTATWYLLDHAPFMVYGEVPLPDGRVQRMTEVAVPRPPTR